MAKNPAGGFFLLYRAGKASDITFATRKHPFLTRRPLFTYAPLYASACSKIERQIRLYLCASNGGSKRAAASTRPETGKRYKTNENEHLMIKQRSNSNDNVGKSNSITASDSDSWLRRLFGLPVQGLLCQHGMGTTATASSKQERGIPQRHV
jgi:hypothetical protein